MPLLFSQLRSHITSSEFHSFDEFKAAVIKNASSTSKEFGIFLDAWGKSEDRLSNFAARLETISGTRFEIERLLSEIPVEKQMPELLELTFALASKGELKKASNLFFFLQSHLPPEERLDNFMRLGKVFWDYGEKHSDISAIDCAEFHFCMARGSNDEKVRESGESWIKTTHDQLEELASSGTEEQKREARNLLDQIRIGDLLDPFGQVLDESEFRDLKANPAVKEAFEIASALQERIDTVDAPKPFNENSQIIDILDGDQTLPVHVIITGTRQEFEGKKEPVVILEPGLGCFSADWHLLQDQLPPDIQVISYDREGMGWSGKNEAATPERTIEVLRRVMEDQGLGPPYVFVGHSYGGFLAQMYALRYPDEIQGIVLVDSALETVTPLPTPPPKTAFDRLPPAARARYVQNDRGDFLDPPTGLVVNTVGSKSNHINTYEEELNHALPHARDFLLENLTETTQFACPLKVIVAGVYVPDAEKSEEENERAAEHWKEGQEALLIRSKSDETAQVIARNSDHFIMYSEPEEIREQICRFFKRAG